MIQEELQRYSRQLLMPEIGVTGQEKLRQSKVLIVGAGGLGSPVALYLAAAGVGTITIADFDKVSLCNLQRQILYTTLDLGRAKTDSTAKRLQNLNPGIEISVVEDGLNPDNAETIIEQVDIVVDCCDNFSTRLLIDEVCTSTGTPWIYGAVEGFDGMIAIFNSSEGKHLTDLFSDLDKYRNIPVNPVGVIGAAAGIIGCSQALECLKFLIGLPHLKEGKVLIFDLMTMTTQIIDF